MRLLADAIGWTFILLVAFLLLFRPFAAVLIWALNTLGKLIGP